MRVLLVADRPGWAYDILAQSIKKYSRQEYIEIKYVSNIRGDIDQQDFSKYDVVFFFLWYDAMRYGVKVNGFDFNKTCVGIHSLSSWRGRGLSEKQASLVCNQFAATGYISEEINHLLKLKSGFPTPNGIESSIFFEGELPPTDELRFMWVGNPGSAHHGINKGFHTIIKPVLDEFAERGVRLVTATPENPVLRENMGDFYRANHVLLCASSHEGGPMPIVEALACGRPVITTEVGIVPEIVEDGKNGLIFTRSRTGLRNMILKISENRRLISKMGKYTTDSVSDRTASHMAESYDKMFDFVFNTSRGE
ncbi:glycosyltransferase family 4 protein [Candidatus Poseidonia alphae]|nr:glycosyltransferase family 4 protein [Candidatus Poseidonia alphae]